MTELQLEQFIKDTCGTTKAVLVMGAVRKCVAALIAGKPIVSCRAKRFDFKAFKKYVETYDPAKHGGNKAETIFEDMLYGLGLAVDKKHQWSDGFRQFKKWLSARLHGS